MFNSTHTFVGLAIAKTGPETWVPRATITAVIASNLPDLDSVAGFWGTATYLDQHRGITHSLIGIPFLALLLAAVMYFFSGNFWRTYAVALIAMATHPALDYLNPYGLRPFLPWNGTWYYGDYLVIIDLYLDAALLLGLLAGWLLPNRKRLAAFVSLVLAMAYIGVRVELHRRAVAKVEVQAAHLNGTERWAVLPTGSAKIWDVISSSQNHLSRTDICALPCKRIETEMVQMDSAPSSDIVMQAAAARSAKELLNFARFPVTHVEQLGTAYRVTFSDFRFYSPARNTSLAAEVMLDRSGRVLKEDISFIHRVN
jgi:membrane-bound metal-dependent hydrolase YbcI (DUF457 family)